MCLIGCLAEWSPFNEVGYNTSMFVTCSTSSDCNLFHSIPFVYLNAVMSVIVQLYSSFAPALTLNKPRFFYI